MKKLILFAIILLFCGQAYAQTQKSDDKLLEEAAILSRQVKEFEKTIEIEPSAILTKTSKESPPFSTLLIYMQRRGTIANVPEIKFTFIFSKQISDTPISGVYTLNKNFSVYWRQAEALASNDEVTITPDFAKGTKLRQIEVNIHEDLHKNTTQLCNTEYCESLVTPIAYIAAELFFKKNGDFENAGKAKAYIEYLRKVSLDLNSLNKDATEIFENADHYFGDAQEKVYSLINSTTYYSRSYAYKAQDLVKMGANERDPLEALISHDMYYLKDFDRIVSLYEKIGDLKTLVEEMKNAPAETAAVAKYLDKLEQKYANPAK